MTPSAPILQYTARGFAHGGGDFVIYHVRGDAGAIAFGSAPPATVYRRLDTAPVRRKLPGYVSGAFGYGYCSPVLPGISPGTQIHWRGLVLPYWLLMAPLVLVAVPRWVGHWRHQAARRIAAGLCARCGYDVRASPERCPECGLACRAAGPAPSAGGEA